MNSNITTGELHPFVIILHGEIKTTSLKVAEHFGKRHCDVLRAIKNIECPEDFRLRNFALSSYLNEQGKSQPCYEMTKDGFTLIAMGFTGKAVMQWKLAYLNAFNQMEKQLLGKSEQPSIPEKPTQKSMPGCLTLDQQDTIKALVKSRAEELPSEKRAGATIKMWSSIKKKFGVSYKKIPVGEFVNVISLVSRLPLAWEYLPKEQTDLFITESDYRSESRKAINKHLEAYRDDMKAAGLQPRNWPTLDEKIISGLAASILWHQRWLVSFNPDNMKPHLSPVPTGANILTDEQWIKYMTQERGYVVVKKSELLKKLES